MKRKITYTIYGLVIWFAAFLVWEWAVSYPKVRWNPVSFPKTTEEKMDSLLGQSMVDFLLPGVAVGVVKSGKTVYLKSFGYKNLEFKDSLTLKTQIPVASISKIFTALSAANYFESQKMPISTRLENILPKENPLPLEIKQLSIHQLLTHTSGLRDAGEIREMFRFHSNRSLHQLPALLQKSKLESAGYHYADINFDLLGYVIENQSKIPFESFAFTQTLEKAGMKSSQFAMDWPMEGNSIVGYEPTFLWKRLETKPLRFSQSPSPSSSLILTPEDLAMAMIHLSRGPMSDFHKELAWLKKENEFPAGFQQITLNEKNYLGHYGEQAGFSSILLFSEDWALGFFVLTNAKDSFEHRNQIAQSLEKLLTQSP